jgi:hypothetical protein
MMIILIIGQAAQMVTHCMVSKVTQMTANAYMRSEVTAQCTLDLSTSTRLRLSEDLSCSECEETANPEQPEPV